MLIQKKPRIGFLVATTCLTLSGTGCREPECDPRIAPAVGAQSAALTASPTSGQLHTRNDSPEYWQEQWRKQVKLWWNVDLDQETPVAVTGMSQRSAFDHTNDGSSVDFAHNFERDGWKFKKLTGQAGQQQIHFVVISEGFMQPDRKAFEERAQSIASAFVSEETFEPYRKGITFWSAFAPSQERGVSCDDDTAREKPSHFGASFPIACLNAKYGTKFNDRFVMLTKFAKIQNFIRHLQTVTGGEKVVPFFLMQADKYGGAAAPLAAMSTGSTDEVAVHELGHSFAGLMDEYVAEGDPCLMFQALGPNISIDSKDRTRVKWAQWIERSTPVPTPLSGIPVGTIGFFRGAANCKMELFKPSQKCKMENHSEPFCSVCKEQVILKMYESLRPARTGIQTEKLVGTQRSYRFKTETLRHDIAMTWWVDGKLAFQSPSNAPLELELPRGRHEIVLQAQDATPFVRRNRCALAQTIKTSVDVP